jgi:hypothetical protein
MTKGVGISKKNFGISSLHAALSSPKATCNVMFARRLVIAAGDLQRRVYRHEDSA